MALHLLMRGVQSGIGHAASVIFIFVSYRSHAGGRPFGIDRRIPYDNSGIWKPTYQTDQAIVTAVFVTAGAL